VRENLSSEKFHPIFEHAEKLGSSIFVHPWEMMGQIDMEKYWLPWLVGMPAETSRAICSIIFGGILEKYPNLDTLSMGMSSDLDLAIKNGATFVRIGTDIFGKRS
jgi:predicted TIM-barrel fold metal-dependent hydrolase